jgi:two-component system, chemotaxis family, protein-glutamate methylesterase/glutaminase
MPEKKKILIAEDDKILAKYFEKILINSGYNIDIAYDGKEAYEKLKNTHYDALMTDWMMPKIDGINLIRLIRKEIHPSPLIFMITTLGSEMSKNHALDSGADGFLMKPVNPVDLISKLNNIFNISQQTVTDKTELQDIVPATALPPFVAVVIASSTGGPSTLMELFKKMQFTNRASFYIVQHGPAWMFESFAKRIEEVTAYKAIICNDNLPSEPGNIYIAPGDKHITIEPETFNILLNDGPRENFVRPAADPLFRSAAKAFGKYCIAVVLTGLGADGTKGAGVVYSAKGKILVQDPATAIAPSMPTSVIRARVPHTLVNIDDMHSAISGNIYPLYASLQKEKKSFQ